MKIGTNQEQEIGTVVGANVRLQGTLKDSSDVTVHGVVEGEVISQKVVRITETATIKGPVTAETVIVAGVIKGSIEAKNKLEILATGVVNGAIATGALIIHEGAVFNGKSLMQEPSQTSSVTKDDKSLSDRSDKELKSDKNKSESDFEIE